ncbi:MAG: hypothetical protein K2K80_05795 [Clostridia bacterium]|nr:hypothetical protein [Clostridia bacterium]
MAENEKVLETEETPAPAPVVEEAAPAQVEEPVSTPVNQEPKKSGFKAKAKEWLRKKVVALKRAPHNIPLVFLAIVTIYYLLVLFNVSQAINSSAANVHVKATGICVFVTTLLSLLVLVSFLNAFPKRKKPNIFFIVLVFVMIAAMIACDVVYYVQMNTCLANITAGTSMYQSIESVQPYVLVHIVLLGVSAIVFALLPVYAKLINKINTKVELESATENMHGEIDIEED